MSSISKSSPSVLPASSPSSNMQASSPPGSSRARLFEHTHNLRLSTLSETSGVSSDTSLSLNTDYTGPIIPPFNDKSFRRRTLVLCFDGTGDQFDLDNSNVIQFFSVLRKGDRKRQLVYYQSGIGTYSIPQVATPLYSKFSKTLDLMFANNLNHHVMSGYNFLMQNYKDGDKICIFGFSRGAYTARALAGMIHKVGLLPAGNEQQVPFAYKMYKNDTELGWRQSVAFKRTFSMDVDIDFVGVWDTVASVGLLPTTLPFTKSNTAIKVFRHALSLDEHRAKFKPSIYQRITAEEAERGDFTPPPTRKSSPTVTRGRKKEKIGDIVKVEEVRRETTVVEENKEIGDKSQSQDAVNGEKMKTATTKTKITQSSVDERRSESGSRSRALLGSIKRSAREVQDIVGRVSLDRDRSKSRGDGKENLSPDSERDQLEQMYLDRSRRTDVLEVWFAGCHCDVGGGSVPNATANSLARIPLRWMIRECFLARTGIQFEANRLRDLGIDPATLHPRVMKPLPENIKIPIRSEVPPPSQEIAVGGESTAEKDCAKGNQEAVTVIKTEESTVSEMNMTLEHNRRNNVSLDATLVNFDSESIDAPNVHIEGASVMDLASTASECDAVCNPPHLEGAAPNKLDDTLKPTPSTSKSRVSTSLTLESQQDGLDARSDIYDQLRIAKWWWILEFIPFRERVQLKDGTWKKKWSINRGRARVVPHEEPLNVHRSVKMRMEAKDLKYKPRVKFDKEPVWVD